MKTKWILFLVLALLLLAACGPQPTTAPTQAPVPGGATPTRPAGAVTAPTTVPGKAAEFHGAWPYTMPPDGHFNTYLTAKCICLGVYQDMLTVPFALYKWADDSYIPMLATKWENKGATFEVTLRATKWSNGDAVTSKDVVATFNVARLLNQAVWKYITKVEAKDPTTIVFSVGTQSTLLERLILRSTYIRDYATYGPLADKIGALYAGGKDANSDEGKALVKELNDFRPKEIVSSGPYVMDLKTLTESQVTLVKNPNSWDAALVAFDKLVIYQGETAAITPLVLSGDVDYATHGFPPATEKSFIEKKFRIQRSPLFTGPALVFNYDVYPFAKVEVRQAMAYLMKRKEAGVVALGDSGVPVKYMSGMSDNLVPLWMTPADVAKLNTYDYDPAKAEALLKGIGFTKGADGIWVDDKGKKMDYELIVPSDFADWSAGAEVVASDLTKGGVKITIRGVQSQQQLADVQAGKFTLSFRNWGIGNPHPFYSYEADLFSYNYVRTTTGKGMNFPLKQQSKVGGGEVDLEKLTLDTGVGTSAASQKPTVSKLALVYNELLPQIPIWERYGNNPMVDTRVQWTAESDPIFKNSHGTDNFVVILIMTGQLKAK